MNANRRTVEDMTWHEYVKSITDENNTLIGKRVGITGASVGRWKVSRPDPQQAANFARAYGRPVLEAFVAAGFLSAEEAKERPTAQPSLDELDDDDLLREVRRRMGRSKSDVADQDQKNTELPLTTWEEVDLVADHPSTDTDHTRGGL